MMKLSEEDYDLMLNASWSAFENTLFLWGVSQESVDKFSYILDMKDGYNCVDDALSEVIELEDE